MKVKADEDLFYRWKALNVQIDGIASIVQNDMEITEEEWKDWCNNTTKLIRNIRQLRFETCEHLSRPVIR
jgi:hypothetical protein